MFPCGSFIRGHRVSRCLTDETGYPFKGILLFLIRKGIWFAEKSSVTCFAKVLDHAFSRDSGARIGDDVVFIKGGGKSGGSAKNWRTIVEKGSIAMLYRVNRNIYNAWEDDPRIEVKLMKDNGVTPDTDGHKWQERLVRMITEDGK